MKKILEYACFFILFTLATYSDIVNGPKLLSYEQEMSVQETYLKYLLRMQERAFLRIRQEEIRKQLQEYQANVAQHIARLQQQNEQCFLWSREKEIQGIQNTLQNFCHQIQYIEDKALAPSFWKAIQNAVKNI